MELGLTCMHYIRIFCIYIIYMFYDWFLWEYSVFGILEMDTHYETKRLASCVFLGDCRWMGQGWGWPPAFSGARGIRASCVIGGWDFSGSCILAMLSWLPGRRYRRGLTLLWAVCPIYEISIYIHTLYIRAITETWSSGFITEVIFVH